MISQQLQEFVRAMSLEGMALPPPPELHPPGSADFSLEDQLDHWTIHGIPYRNNTYSVDLLKTLLDNGQAKTQDQWSAYSRQALQAHQFHVADALLSHSLFAQLYHHREQAQHQDKLQPIAAFLKQAMVERWLMTLSRARYDPAGSDQVIHNIGLPDQYELQAPLVGPDEWVKDAASPAPYQALLGSASTKEIQDIYHWLTGQEARLYRVNSTLPAVDERAVWFCAFSGGCDLNCDGDLRISYAALGVRLRAAGAQKN
jgi:hypothetical protein